MESNDNLNRQLADQEKECYEVFLFIVNQGFQRLLSRLKSWIILFVAFILNFVIMPFLY